MANQNVIPKVRSALQSVRKGALDTPYRVLVYGGEKVGKSTFAAGAPSPIFIGADSGSERLNIDRLEPTSWAEAVEWTRELATTEHTYKTIVIDPINWLEPLCWAAVVGDGGGTIESYGGGYGKGYLAALDLWRAFAAALERCWRKGMHVVIAAHAQVKTFQNPEGAPYDRYEIAMNAKAAGLFRQWVDAVLFVRLETFAKLEKGQSKAKGYSTGARIMHTQPSAAFDAGTRWKLPEEIPLGWDDLVSAIKAQPDAGTLADKVARLVVEVNDPKVTEASNAWVTKYAGNADRLAELVNRLEKKLDEKKEKES